MTRRRPDGTLGIAPGSTRASTGVPTLRAGVNESMTIQIHLLGAFAVSTSRGPVPAVLWHSTRARSLFTYLAYRAGTPMSRASLLAALWPDLDPEACLHTLYKAAYLLRQTLASALDGEGRDLLEFSDGYYRIHAEGLQVDVLQFKQALFEAAWCARLKDSAGVLSHYEAAVALYGGHLLEDDYCATWTIPERERLRSDYNAALRALAAQHQESNAERSAFYYRLLLATGAYVDEACRALIEMALAAGRRGEALRLYRQHRDRMAHELARRPSPELAVLVKAAG